MILDCPRMILGTTLHGYLVNYGGLYNSVFSYLSKNRGFSSFQGNLPPELTFLYPLTQSKVFLMTMDYFKKTLGTILHGYKLNYLWRFVKPSFHLLVENRDFSSFQVNLPPTFLYTLRQQIFFLTTLDCFRGTLETISHGYLVNMAVCITLSVTYLFKNEIYVTF